MLEKIEQLRKAPQKVKERVVGLVTILCIAAITLLWFVLTVSSFLNKSVTATSIPDNGQQSGQTTITPPFLQ